MSWLTPEFCPGCGEELEARNIDERERRYCVSCDEVIWRNPTPAAGVIVTDGDEILLIKRGIEPDRGEWSIPAGFIERDEPPRQAAARELEEETSVTVDPGDLELFDTVFMHQKGRGYVLGIVYIAEIEAAGGEPSAGDDADKAEFRRLEEFGDGGEKLREAYIGPVKKAVGG